ncbi:DoxX family membrane protein [Paracoccus sp. S-4012]|nr:DoxX family membrane protein [Paracoccus sp. S-4012]
MHFASRGGALSVTVAVAFLVRLSLVALFLPFSARDKLRNFGGAVAQARGIGVGVRTGRTLVLAGLFVEVVMSLGVLTGIADRMAALVLALYCVATALLYKRFWLAEDREVFWEFWKNIAVAGGFLLITFGTGARDVAAFFEAPFSSTHPYSMNEAAR